MKIKIGNDERSVDDLIREKTPLKCKYWIGQRYATILDYDEGNDGLFKMLPVIWCLFDTGIKAAVDTNHLEYWIEGAEWPVET